MDSQCFKACKVALILKTFIFISIFSVGSVFAGDQVEGISDTTAIAIPCVCVGECDLTSENSCVWVQEYIFRIYNGEITDAPKELAGFSNQRFSLLDVVDYGYGGCFTSFGLSNDGDYVRYDVVVDSETDFKVLHTRFETVASIPSLEERKRVPSKDLCLLRFDYDIGV
jgi:hypothetical protein